jgi:hypothetical protein
MYAFCAVLNSCTVHHVPCVCVWVCAHLWLLCGYFHFWRLWPSQSGSTCVIMHAPGARQPVQFFSRQIKPITDYSGAFACHHFQRVWIPHMAVGRDEVGGRAKQERAGGETCMRPAIILWAPRDAMPSQQHFQLVCVSKLLKCVIMLCSIYRSARGRPIKQGTRARAHGHFSIRTCISD